MAAQDRPQHVAAEQTPEQQEASLVDDLVEDVSIDGMCGVY